MAHRTVFASSYVRDHATLQAAAASFPIVSFRDEGSAASNVLTEQRQALDASWAGGNTLSSRFDAFRQLDEQARADWLAHVMEIGRAHVCTPVTNAQLVCRLLLEKKKENKDKK